MINLGNALKVLVEAKIADVAKLLLQNQRAF